MKKIPFLFFIFYFLTNLYATQCSPYFNPDKFYDAPEYLQKMLDKYTNNNKSEFTEESKVFDIKVVELYRFTEDEIANDINDNFGGFWNEWIEDGYEMQLVPEQTLFRYKDNYFSLQVLIYGVVGDATTLKGTTVEYHFYNYTKEVNKHILCKKQLGDK